ncbi:ABC transporter substrate-binding protein [uncultured Intestinimonas sp.]|uniref:ABC transporter substrate-binding protein n=1 Tax=uncultured Intestinimonas sp. TaxID=1689265 RepID=UPI0025F48E02|nr:ABC transporter substrate-binding protein [uncultured Intestinimonas sp.]
MKKFLAFALSCSLALTALAGCSSTPPSSAAPETGSPDASAPAAQSGDKVVRIGVFEPSTGDSASGGKKEMLGMQYANTETPTVEVGGETYSVELVYADNGSTTDKAPTAASQLVSEGVALVLGSYGSGVSIAGGPIFGDAGIPAIGVTCTNPNVTAGNDYYFRICFLDPFQGTVLANFAKDKFSATTAYCLGEAGNEYDQGLIAYFEQAFTAAGGTVIKDSFPTNNSDFNSYLNKAKDQGADVIFTPVSIAYATQIITQAADLGIEAPFLGSDTLDDNMVLEAAKGTNVQLYVSTFYQEGGNPDFDEGIKNYINTADGALEANGGNDTIAAVSAMGYDAYYVALEAIKAAGSVEPADIKAALWDVTYDGVSGHIEFDDTNGDAVRDTAYIKHSTNDGAWELEGVQTVAQ